MQDRDLTCPVRGLALGQAEQIWSAAADPDLFNRHKDMAWLIAHGVLSVRAVMHVRRMARTPVCPRGACVEPETLHHVLWDCNFAQVLWRLAQLLLRCFLSGGTLDGQVVLFGGSRSTLGGPKWRASWLIINAWALWVCRSYLVLEERTLSPIERKGLRKGLRAAGLDEAWASKGTEHVGDRRLGHLGLGLRLTLGARCFVLGEWVQMENVC